MRFSSIVVLAMPKSGTVIDWRALNGSIDEYMKNPIITKGFDHCCIIGRVESIGIRLGKVFVTGEIFDPEIQKLIIGGNNCNYGLGGIVMEEEFFRYSLIKRAIARIRGRGLLKRYIKKFQLLEVLLIPAKRK